MALQQIQCPLFNKWIQSPLVSECGQCLCRPWWHVYLPSLLDVYSAFPQVHALLDLTELEPRSEYKLNTVLSNIFGALAPIGALFSGPIAGWITDLIGRKASLMLVGVPYLLGFLTMVYAHFINNALIFKVVLLTGRFFTGVGLGWSCLATPVYLAEISSHKLRGVLISFTEIFLSVGILLVFFLGSFQNFQYYHSSLVLSGIVAVYELLMVFLYETPRWLLAHNYKEEAINALKFLRGAQNDITKELSMIENEITEYPKLTIFKTVRELGRRKVLVPFLIMCSVMFFQQIGGIAAAEAYSALIFKEANVNNSKATSVYAVGGAALMFTVIGAAVIDCFGWKVLLIISGIGMLIGSVVLGAYFYVTRSELYTNSTSNTPSDTSDIVCNSNFTPIAIASLILFSAAFSFGWGPVPWALIGELIPLRVRGVGSGIVTSVNWGTAAIVTGFYLNYAGAVHNWFAWWTFSVFNLIGIVFVIMFVFETKGKHLEDIHHRFDSKRMDQL